MLHVFFGYLTKRDFGAFRSACDRYANQWWSVVVPFFGGNPGMISGPENTMGNGHLDVPQMKFPVGLGRCPCYLLLPFTRRKDLCCLPPRGPHLLTKQAGSWFRVRIFLWLKHRALRARRWARACCFRWLAAGRLLSGRAGCGWGGWLWLSARAAHFWWGWSAVAERVFHAMCGSHAFLAPVLVKRGCVS